MRLVLDTNVVVSALINPGGKPSQIMKMIFSRKAELYCNSIILNEYETVMLRPKFANKIHSGNVRRLIDIIRKIGISFNPFPGDTKLSDESDQIFYDTARGSGSILISGNIKHFPKEPFIMLPADFLKWFEGGKR
ncbi:MAG: putative toxin-antitoxin system toxin component, PIN family [Treponema sp.]|nr:putative toxin-antitoxin system toxin component, PIN family [Treponema sp.]